MVRVADIGLMNAQSIIYNCKIMSVTLSVCLLTELLLLLQASRYLSLGCVGLQHTWDRLNCCAKVRDVGREGQWLHHAWAAKCKYSVN